MVKLFNGRYDEIDNFDDNFKSKILLKLSDEEYMNVITPYTSKKYKYKCVFTYEKNELKEQIDLYKIIFDEKLKKQLFENLKYIPDDIIENCKKCTAYKKCKNKNKMNMLINYEYTNEILKEYKELIKNNSEID